MDQVAALNSPSGLLLSVYLNRLPQGASAQIADLLKPLRVRLDSLDRASAKALRQDLDRVHHLAPRVDAATAPAVVIFASSSDGIFAYHTIDSPVWDHASFGPRPYLRPLRAIPRPVRTGVAVADRRRVSLLVADNGRVEKIGPVLEAERLKDNFGGFSGYEEYGARQHVSEVTTHLWREAAARLMEAHQEQPFDLLVVGGHEETLDEFTGHLHPYLRSLPSTRLVVDPRTLTPATLRARVGEVAAGARRAEEEHLLETLLTALDRGGLACRGVASVLAAVNQAAVDRLVVAGRFAVAGVVCERCRFLGRVEAVCPQCGGRTLPVEDVVAEAMEEVLTRSGRVDQVGVASRLDADGVGAFLRFAVAM
jgi:hypothetical protein